MRTLINAAPTVVVGQDDGAIQLSLSSTERKNIKVTVQGDAYADIGSWTVAANMIEANNTTGTGIPTTVKQGVSAAAITVFNQATNTFELRMDMPTLITAASPQPTVGNPIYYFLSVSLTDTAASNPQTTNIIRGTVQVVYNP